jgi:dTDP-glucose 4,6-dehydratase
MVDTRRPNPLAADLDHVLGVGRDLWDDLRGARLFLTGGTGFFGSWLLETFLWANDRRHLGASVVVLTRTPQKFAARAPHLGNHPTVTLVGGDVRSFDFPEGSFSHVVHAATPSSTPVGPRLLFDTIVEGTRRVLQLAHASGAGRFLLTSSGAVYGPQPPELTHVPEDYTGAPNPADPGFAYGEGKRAAEMLCAVYADAQLQPTIARCFAFVGPYLPLDAHFAAGNFIRDALKGGPIRVSGDGTPLRSYLYAADLAVWLWTILLRAAPLRPYNVGSESAVSVGDLALAVAAAMTPACEVLRARTPTPGATPPRYVPSTARAQQELGLHPSVSLDHAIAKTTAWHHLRQVATERVNV